MILQMKQKTKFLKKKKKKSEFSLLFQVSSPVSSQIPIVQTARVPQLQ